MTFKELIEKMEKENTVPQIVVAGFIKDSLSIIQDKNKKYQHRLVQKEFISGIIWGLYAAGFLSDEEKENLFDIYIDDKKGESL